MDEKRSPKRSNSNQHLANVIDSRNDGKVHCSLGLCYVLLTSSPDMRCATSCLIPPLVTCLELRISLSAPSFRE